jgi:DNA (cytosine-5)-methyltransferase 1
MPAQTGTERLAVVSPFLVTLRTNGDARSAADPAAAVCASGNHHVVVQDAPFIVPIQGHARAKSATDALPTQLAECSHDMVIQGAAQISLRDTNAMRVAGLERELMTQGCAPQAALIQRAPFLINYQGRDNASPIDAAAPTMSAGDHRAVVEPTPALRVEDCYFRMLQPHEIGAAMAFPNEYIVGGNKRDRVKQYGNAVTPPVMDWIVRQCAATLAPELEEPAA